MIINSKSSRSIATSYSCTYIGVKLFLTYRKSIHENSFFCLFYQMIAQCLHIFVSEKMAENDALRKKCTLNYMLPSNWCMTLVEYLILPFPTLLLHAMDNLDASIQGSKLTGAQGHWSPDFPNCPPVFEVGGPKGPLNLLTSPI